MWWHWFVIVYVCIFFRGDRFNVDGLEGGEEFEEFEEYPGKNSQPRQATS
jgi:hypothetical protein